MTGGETRVGERCPECETELVQSEPRFSRWCRACDWNVDPMEQATGPPGGLARLRRRIEDRVADRLYAELANRPIDRPGFDLPAVLSIALAVVVHLLPLGLLALAGWLVYAARGSVMAWVGVVLLVGVAFVVRPRFARLDPDAHLVARDQAPQLYALVDRLCDQLGAPRVHHIELSTVFNAGAGLFGIRNRRVLVIGLPLWTVLSRQERIAVLGHELGHFVNGDPARHGLVRRAVLALHRLDDMFRGDAGPLTPAHDGFFTILEWLAQLLLWVLSLPVRALVIGISLLTFQSMQRAEYLADQLGSQLGGTEATLSSFEIQLLDELCMTHLSTSARRAGVGDLWEAERAYVTGFPALERERLLRAAARERSRVDQTHPPTHLRMKLAGRPERRVSAAVVLGQGEADAIERELKPWYDKLGKYLKDELMRELYV